MLRVVAKLAVWSVVEFARSWTERIARKLGASYWGPTVVHIAPWAWDAEHGDVVFATFDGEGGTCCETVHADSVERFGAWWMVRESADSFGRTFVLHEDDREMGEVG